MRWLTAASLAVGAAYVLWRATTLGTGWTLAVSVPLLLVEIWAFAELALLGAIAHRLPEPLGSGRPRHRLAPVDVAVIVAGRGAAELERSLLAVRLLDGRGRVVVVDDVDRHALATLAADLGATYRVEPDAVSDAVAVAHRATASERYLWLTAGEVPVPHLLAALDAAFDDETVAVCQAGASVLNADSLVHLRRARDDDALVNQVVGPALSRWGAAPWLGSGAVIRRRAIDSAGIGDRPSMERLTARLHADGWATRFGGRPLVAVTAAENLGQLVADRRRRMTATLGLLASAEGPLGRSTSSVRHRIAALGPLARSAAGLRLLVLAALTVIVLVTGRFPSSAPASTLVPAWAVAATAGVIGRRALARGSMTVGDWVRQGWRTASADLAALRTVVRERGGGDDATRRSAGGAAPSGLRALTELRLVAAAVVALDVAVLVRASTIVDTDLLPPFATAERMAVIAFSLGLLVPATDVLQVVARRRQRRAHPRLRIALAAELDGLSATTVDITPHGVGLRSAIAPTVGSTTGLRVTLPTGDGTARRITGQAIVRDVSPAGPGVWRVGLELVRLTPDARRALVEFCAVGHLVADHQVAAGGPTIDLTAAPVEQLTVARSMRQRRALRVATGAAATAGILTVLFGPAAGTAIAFSPSIVDTVCARSASGDALVGVVVERTIDTGEIESLGVTDTTGCLAVGAREGTTDFVVSHDGERRSVEPAEYLGTRIEVSSKVHQVRVVRPDGTPVADAPVRFFSTRWHPGESVDGAHRFEGLAVEVGVEVTVGGARSVVADAVAGDAAVRIATVRLDGELTSGEIDHGAGWEPFRDGMDLAPGRVAVRWDGEEVRKLDVPPGHELRLPSGDLVEIAAPADSDPDPEPTPSPDAEPDPASDAGDESVPGPDRTETTVVEGAPTGGGAVESGVVEGGPTGGGAVESGVVEGGPTEGGAVEGEPAESGGGP